MNTLSHVLMGRFLHDYVRKKHGIALNKESFVWGNVLPDYRISFIQRPHFIANSLNYVQRKISRLLKQQRSACRGKTHSKELGILCHYYADFFCFAHTPDFGGNLYQHVRYEDKLYQYFLKHYEEFKIMQFIHPGDISRDADFIGARFSQLQSSYLQARPSFDNDLIYSILACTELIVILTDSTAVPSHDEKLAFISPQLMPLQM